MKMLIATILPLLVAFWLLKRWWEQSEKDDVRSFNTIAFINAIDEPPFVSPLQYNSGADPKEYDLGQADLSPEPMFDSPFVYSKQSEGKRL